MANKIFTSLGILLVLVIFLCALITYDPPNKTLGYKVGSRCVASPYDTDEQTQANYEMLVKLGLPRLTLCRM